MKEQNEVLYYKLVQENLKEMFKIVYTPTEGEAIQQYSRLFRRPEGCFLSIDEQDKVEECMARWGGPDDIDLIVVSDGEQILGIGDQGVGAILISIAKLAIYTLCAGIHPHRTLPVVLDCGTNNKELLEDDLYLGLPQERVRGEKYDKFVDTFVNEARKQYPNAYIHFEASGGESCRGPIFISILILFYRTLDSPMLVVFWTNTHLKLHASTTMFRALDVSR
jgi:malate dehydrogenase (oxaloacetate-decarboxylating)